MSAITLGTISQVLDVNRDIKRTIPILAINKCGNFREWVAQASATDIARLLNCFVSLDHACRAMSLSELHFKGT